MCTNADWRRIKNWQRKEKRFEDGSSNQWLQLTVTSCISVWVCVLCVICNLCHWERTSWSPSATLTQVKVKFDILIFELSSQKKPRLKVSRSSTWHYRIEGEVNGCFEVQSPLLVVTYRPAENLEMAVEEKRGIAWRAEIGVKRRRLQLVMVEVIRGSYFCCVEKPSVCVRVASGPWRGEYIPISASGQTCNGCREESSQVVIISDLISQSLKNNYSFLSQSDILVSILSAAAPASPHFRMLSV